MFVGPDPLKFRGILPGLAKPRPPVHYSSTRLSTVPRCPW
jgi:hypothetical protein